MSENTKIEWTDHTFNPWTGCTKVSPGCANCYAEGWAKRSGIVKWGKGAPRRKTSTIMWKMPIKWNSEASGQLSSFLQVITKDGQIHRGTNKQIAALNLPLFSIADFCLARPRVFCASLADWLDDEVPIEWLADLLDLIRLTPNLDWLLLTKRPELFSTRIADALAYLNEQCWMDDQPSDLYTWVHDWFDGNPPSNVWIGTTVEDQKRADERIPLLLEIPAKVRFLSCEPLLEPVCLPEAALLSCVGCGNNGSIAFDSRIGNDSRLCLDACIKHGNPSCIHWVICGGESGSGHRPFDPDWARSLRDQCKDSGVAFFMKQMGGARKPFPEIPDDLMIREFPKGGEA